MRGFRAWFMRFRGLFGAGRRERELAEEIESHLRMHVEDNLRAGMTPEEARRVALVKLGGVEATKESCRDRRGIPALESVLQDVRYGARMLRKNPGFTAVTVITLALGIGTNTAIFSAIDAVLLAPLPYDDPERLVMVWEDASFAGFPRNDPAPANYADWKAQNRVFEGMAAMAWRDFSLTGDGEPEKVSAYAVTADFFPLLGVEPALGRTFLPEEERPGADRVAVISNALWRGRYGGDRAIVGRQILLNGQKYSVVGVMPPRFQFLEGYVGLWVPLAFDQAELANRGNHYLTVVARTREGVTPEQAQADIQAIMARIASEHVEAARLGAVVLPLREQLAGEVRQPLVVLLASVGLLLLIACANVANLLLARAVNRRKEIAVRAALGASRARVARQLVTESVLIAGLGGLVGLMLAYGSLAFLRQLIPETMRLTTDLAIDGRVLGFTLLLALVTGVAFGLAPALLSSTTDLDEALKSSGGRSGIGGGGRRLRGALVVAQVGLAVVLLVGAGLLIKTFLNLVGQYSALQAESVLTLRTTLARSRYDTHGKRVAFYDAALERVKALPGVLAAGYTTSVPLEWKGGTSGFVVEGRQFEPGLSYDAIHRQVSAGYLQAIGIPLRRGRHFAESDTAGSLPVAIVNETMARQYWPGEDPVGKRFKVGDPDTEEPWLTVVGVAADVRQMGADVPVKAEMYLPYRQTDYNSWFAPRDLALRTVGDPAEIVAAVRREIRAVDPEQPISNVRMMSEVVGEETSDRRVGMLLIAAFAGLALLLASVGIYGLLSYFVVQHTPEIGVRVALGARPRDILVMVLRTGMTLALVGAGLGLVAALALTRVISSLLFGVDASDPATFAGAPLLLLAVALLACSVPARRAARVDPNVALKYE